MWQRWGTTRPEEDLEGVLQASCSPAARLNPLAGAQVRNENPHDWALIEARRWHQRALEATHLLEQNIERLSWAARKVKSTRCWCSYSSRMQSQGRCPSPLAPPGWESIWLSRTKRRRCPPGRVPQWNPGTDDWRRRSEREWPGSSAHPRAGAGALPGGINTHAGCWG